MTTLQACLLNRLLLAGHIRFLLSGLCDALAAWMVYSRNLSTAKSIDDYISPANAGLTWHSPKMHPRHVYRESAWASTEKRAFHMYLLHLLDARLRFQLALDF